MVLTLSCGVEGTVVDSGNAVDLAPVPAFAPDGIKENEEEPASDR